MIKAFLFDLDGTLLPMEVDRFLKLYLGDLGQALAPHFPGEQLVEPVVGATYDMIAQPHDGMTNEQGFISALTRRTGRELSLIHILEPTLLASDLQKTTKLRGRFVTNLGNSSAARTHNVKESLKQFNGMVVNPGQEVSFNDTTGPRTAENGYQDAPLIASDKSLQDGPGGGVCQSSTTIYNAILKAGLNSTVRAHHSFPSSCLLYTSRSTTKWVP